MNSKHRFATTKAHPSLPFTSADPSHLIKIIPLPYCFGSHSTFLTCSLTLIHHFHSIIRRRPSSLWKCDRNDTYRPNVASRSGGSREAESRQDESTYVTQWSDSAVIRSVNCQRVYKTVILQLTFHLRRLLNREVKKTHFYAGSWLCIIVCHVYKCL